MAKLHFFKISSKNGLVAWGRKALLMQLFLFLFFNLLLKIFPAELCWISPIALCDGWCISGYGNLNCFLSFYFFFPSWALWDALSFLFVLFLFDSPQHSFCLVQHLTASFRETNYFDSERNNMLNLPFDACSMNITFLVWVCFTPVSDAD